MGIVVFGAIIMDIKGYPLDLYIPGGRNVGRVEHVHGGVGRNVVEDIANIELRPTFVSALDDSDLSQNILKKLQRHKVNTDYITTVPNGLGTWLAVFDNTGDVVASITQRPDLSSILDVLKEHGDEIIKNADSIVLEIDLEKETVKEIYRLAQKYNKKVFAVVTNMSIAMERRDFLKSVDCIVCNLQEAGLLFSENYDNVSPDELKEIITHKIQQAQIPRMVVTMGGDGSVYATKDGENGICPAQKVNVKDTTGAGDSFFAGVTIGLTYGKTLEESCQIGTKLAASVISTSENVCPRFLPSEFGLDV